MALSVNLKPDGFQPVGGGSLIYEFEESDLTGKTNYRVVLQFDGYTSVLPDYEFRPDADLIIIADIAPILRSLLALDETAASRLINTFVKYQAVWDESSDAQVDLSGDVIYAYVGNNNSLNNRTKYDVRTGDGNANMLLAAGVFLSYDNLKLSISKKFFVDFLCDGSLPNNAKIKHYNRDTLATTDISTFDGSVIALQSLEVTISTAGKYYILITNNAGTTFYGILSVDIAAAEYNKEIYLRWINDYGGLTHYLFNYNQLYRLPIGQNDKAKVLRMGAYGLSFDQWLMMQELQKAGIIYNDNYKQGQFVQDVTDYDNPIPVIVLEEAFETQTKFVGHNIELSIRYPLIPNTDL